MKKSLWLSALAALSSLLPFRAWAAFSGVLRRNNRDVRGMNTGCSAFSIIRPDNTIKARLVVNRKRVTHQVAPNHLTYRSPGNPGGFLNSLAAGTGSWINFQTV